MGDDKKLVKPPIGFNFPPRDDVKYLIFID
jgi:hypothetical protein